MGYLLYVTDIYGKYAWVVPLKYKKGLTVTVARQKLLDKSNCRPNKLWINKDNKGYNRSMKSWLEKYNIQEKLKEDLLLLKK